MQSIRRPAVSPRATAFARQPSEAITSEGAMNSRRLAGFEESTYIIDLARLHCALQKNSSRTSATGHKRPFCNRRPRLDFHYASSATNLARHCDMSRRANLKGALKVRHG